MAAGDTPLYPPPRLDLVSPQWSGLHPIAGFLIPSPSPTRQRRAPCSPFWGPPIGQPAHLSGPVSGVGLLEQAIQSGDQLGQRHAPLRGQDDTAMVWMPPGQRDEIAGVEGEDAPALGRRSE